MRFEIEAYTAVRAVLIIWNVFVLIGYVFLFTLPNKTEVFYSYFLLYLASLIFIVLDWIIIAPKMGLKGNEPLYESFNTITAENSPKHVLQVILRHSMLLIFFVVIIISIVWSGIYYNGIVNQGRTYIAVPDFYTSVTLASSNIPFVDTVTLTSFFEAITVATTEEQLFTGLFFPTLWGIMLFGASRFGVRENMFAFVIISVILMLISASAMAWVSSYTIHAVAYQSSQPAYNKAYDHFFYANVIDGSTGIILTSIFPHTTNNFIIKDRKYRGTFEAIPLQGINIPTPT